MFNTTTDLHETARWADRAAAARSLNDDTGRAARWWVLHTRPRAEKQLAERLAAAKAPHFLPLVTVRHTYARSRVAFEKPLFPGYVFLHGDEDQRLAALRTNRVVQTLHVADQQRFEHELGQIRAALDAGVALDLFPTIRVGARCRVIDGPLRGVEGRVTGEGARSRLFLAVTVLGQSAVLDIDAGQLEVLD